MPRLLAKSLGLILLLATVGLVTCQSMVKTISVDSQTSANYGLDK